MLNEIAPEVGNIIIAEPFMLDPNFKRSVVILVDKNEEGDLGYIINQKSTLLLKDVIEDCWDADFEIFFGGPVSNNTLHFIHSCPEKITGGLAIGNGLYWGGDFELLKAEINNYNILDSEIKFFIGYSGWVKGQLESEIKENSWIISNKFNPAILFDNSGMDPWKEAIINMGQKFAHIVNFPENPELN
jgi:putative transcriptional regulator